ncbi:Conserved_hypothetical protein [Hexamita inflata]|uniref:Uncharacterized protein n=1 Tax=Hexamita inflata TaxID=28002 RepID=A0AA86QIJ4_9EUKA|nr:Conserved hypothetical protein [Hexamita inflata]
MINPLWLGVQNVDFLAMINDVESIIGTPTDYKAYMKVPYANPLILFAFLPFVGAVLGCLLCIFVCSGACCCSAASRYRKRNKKLQKESHKILIKYGIDAKGALPSSIVADSTQISQEERLQVVQELERQKPLHDKVVKKAKCAKWCWLAWLLSAIIYILSIIFVISGISFFGGMPNAFTKVANEQVTVVTTLLESIAGVADDTLNALYGTNTTVVSELIKNETTFPATLAAFRTDAKLMHSLDNLKGNVSILDGKLVDWLGKILFYPTTGTFQYVTDGQTAINNLLNGFHNLKTTMDGMNATVTSLRTTTVPGSLSAQFGAIPDIPDIPLPAGPTKNILDLLMEGVTLSKWKFSNQIATDFLGSMSTIVPFIDILIPRDVSGNPKAGTPSLLTAAGYTVDTLFDMVKNPITGFVDQIADLLQKVYDSEYFNTMLVLKTISFTELSAQLGTPKSAACPYIWCGKINVTSLTDNFGTIPILSSFKTDSLETLLKKPIPIVYSICLVVPFLILIITALCMGCKKTCCSTCSICCCPFCNCAITILGILLMMLSLVTSGILTPITNSLRSDATNMVDAALKLGQEQSIINPTASFTLPTMTQFTMTPAALNLDMSSMSALLSSISVNTTINQLMAPVAQTPATGMMLSMLDLLGVSSVGEIMNNVINWATTQLQTINLNISLANSDLAKMFSRDQLGIMNMLKVGSKTMQEFLHDTINSALGLVLNDNFDIIKVVLNSTALSTKIGAYTSADLKLKIKDLAGFDIDTSLAGITNGLSDLLQQAYCGANIIPDGARADVSPYVYFGTLSTAYKSAFDSAQGGSVSNPTPPSPVTPTSSLAVEIFESVFISLWLELLADNSALQTTLGNQATLAATSTAASDFVLNKLFAAGTDTALPSISTYLTTISAQAVNAETLSAFETRYSACPTDTDRSNSEGVDPINDYPYANLINVPAQFQNNLIERKVMTTAVARPTVDINTLTGQAQTDAIAAFITYQGIGSIYYYHCVYINQLITAAKSLESASPALGVATSNAAGLASAVFSIRTLKTSLVTFNGIIGTTELITTPASAVTTACGASPVVASATPLSPASFLSSFSTDLVNVVKSLFLNVVQTLIDLPSNTYNLFFKAFADVGILTKIKSFVMTIVDEALTLICGEASPINSAIFGMVPQLMSDSVGAAFGWFDAFSFACYLSFLFMFFGPMCMAFGYNYNRYYNYEKKMSKKYKFKFEFKKEAGHKKRGKKSKQNAELIVANNESGMFQPAHPPTFAPPPQFTSQHE